MIIISLIRLLNRLLILILFRKIILRLVANNNKIFLRTREKEVIHLVILNKSMIVCAQKMLMKVTNGHWKRIQAVKTIK